MSDSHHVILDACHYDQQHSGVFKAAVSLSLTNKELAHNLLWDYDEAKIDIPIMLIAGAGGR